MYQIKLKGETNERDKDNKQMVVPWTDAAHKKIMQRCRG